MLRVNLMEDEGFRRDLLEMARGVLRGVADSLIRETIAREGWLAQRVETYFESNPMHKIVESVIRSAKLYDKPEFLRVIDAKIQDRVRETWIGYKGEIEAQLRKLVRDEIQRCFKVS